MTESALDSVYKEISKLRIGNAKCRNIDKVKLSINKGDLPMRMLLPSTEGELNFVSFGVLTNIQWSIRDLCLWAPITSGAGVEKYAGSMVTYIQQYITKLKTLRNPTANTTVKDVTFSMGPIPWADTDYWAVDVTLTVEEIL